MMRSLILDDAFVDSRISAYRKRENPHGIVKKNAILKTFNNVNNTANFKYTPPIITKYIRIFLYESQYHIHFLYDINFLLFLLIVFLFLLIFDLPHPHPYPLTLTSYQSAITTVWKKKKNIFPKAFPNRKKHLFLKAIGDLRFLLSFKTITITIVGDMKRCIFILTSKILVKQAKFTFGIYPEAEA